MAVAEKGEITELVGLDVLRVDGVESPANGAPWLLLKGAGNGKVTCKLCDGSGKIREGHVKCPDCQGSGEVSPEKAAAQKSDSQESDSMVEMVTGSKPDSALCNAPTADGSRCQRQPAPGQARCHHHIGVALKGEEMDAAKLRRLEQLLPVLRPNTAALRAAQGELYKAALGMERDPVDLAHALEAAEAAAKGQVQDGLHGTATPERGGALSPASGVRGPVTGDIMPGLSNQSPNGLAGVFGPLQGGQSPYAIPAEAQVNGARDLQTSDQSPALAQMVLDRAALTLPGEPANPQLVKKQQAAVKAKVLEALGEVAKAERAHQAQQDRAGFVDHVTQAFAVERSGEELTLAKLRAHAMGEFGDGKLGGW